MNDREQPTKYSILRNAYNRLENKVKQLEKALDKACERLADYTGSCPLEEELVEDLDCNECDNNCKECWVKYFMKEVLGNEPR